MADVIVLNRTLLQPGTQLLGPRSIPVGIKAIGIVIDKTNWQDPNVTLTCLIELSYDNGATWSRAPADFVNEPGGGSEVSVVFDVDQPTSPDREIRATLTIAGGVCDISASVRLLDGTEPRVLAAAKKP